MKCVDCGASADAVAPDGEPLCEPCMKAAINEAMQEQIADGILRETDGRLYITDKGHEYNRRQRLGEFPSD